MHKSKGSDKYYMPDNRNIDVAIDRLRNFFRYNFFYVVFSLWESLCQRSSPETAWEVKAPGGCECENCKGEKWIGSGVGNWALERVRSGEFKTIDRT